MGSAGDRRLGYASGRRMIQTKIERAFPRTLRCADTRTETPDGRICAAARTLGVTVVYAPWLWEKVLKSSVTPWTPCETRSILSPVRIKPFFDDQCLTDRAGGEKLARRARWPRLGGAATKTFSNSSSILTFVALRRPRRISLVDFRKLTHPARADTKSFQGVATRVSVDE